MDDITLLYNHGITIFSSIKHQAYRPYIHVRLINPSTQRMRWEVYFLYTLISCV